MLEECGTVNAIVTDLKQTETVVRLRGIAKQYARGGEVVRVLEKLDLDLPRGDFVALMGPSGSGKTTLLNLIGGLDRPSEGSIEVDGLAIDRLSTSALGQWRADHVGFVFQMYNLLPVLSAERNVELPLLLTSLSRAERMQRVHTALKLVGLEDRAKHRPRELSGGQEQRVGIARAIVTDPTLLLCDEPTGDLDRKSGDEVLDLLQALNRDFGKTTARLASGQGAARTGEPLMLVWLPLIWANMGRRKLRLLFTLASIVVAFAMFGLLEALRTSLAGTVSLAGADRLLTTSKISIIQPLPQSYLEKTRAVAGVSIVAPFNWFGGVVKDGRSQIPVYPTDPNSFLAMYPEVKLPTGAREAWVADRQGIIIGPLIAREYGWKKGDRVPIRSTIYRKEDGGDTWEFNVHAIYDVVGSSGWDKGSIVFHYDYLNESLRRGRDQVGWMVLKIVNPGEAEQVAKRVDALYANSAAETKTATERAFIKQATEQLGNIGAILVSVVSAVFFTMLLVTANTMAQSVRERTSEIGVMKTLGFADRTVLGLVLAESLAMTLIGGLIGLGLAWLMVSGLGPAVEQFLPVFGIEPSTFALALLLMVVMGVIAGLWPAASAMRLKITDALRRGA
jgi:putative ABC transport system permease protein